MASIKHLLNQSVSIENPTEERDRYGKPILQPDLEYAARVERVHKTITSDDKEQEPVHLEVYLPDDAAVVRGGKLTYKDESYRIMSVEDAVGRNGRIHHLELMCQLWEFGE